VEQKQIVTEHEVINLLSDDEDDTEDGEPVAAPAPAPAVETIAFPFVPMAKNEPRVVPVAVPVHHPGTVLPPVPETVPRHPAATVYLPVLASVISPVLPPSAAMLPPSAENDVLATVPHAGHLVLLTNPTLLDAISTVPNGAPTYLTLLDAISTTPHSVPTPPVQGNAWPHCSPACHTTLFCCFEGMEVARHKDDQAASPAANLTE